MHLFLYSGDRAERSALVHDALAKRNILPVMPSEWESPPAGSIVLFEEGAPGELLYPLLDAPVRILGTVDALPQRLASHPAVRLLALGEHDCAAIEGALFAHLAPLCISEVLGIPTGITAIVGGGGKTTAMLRIAKELSGEHTCIVGTTTNIFPPELPTLLAPTEEEIRSALKEQNLICIGTPANMGKLGSVSDELLQKLPSLAEYVILEADGSKGLPLKAPAAHEPVIPQNTNHVIALAGMDGANRPIREVCHRPNLYAELLGTDEDHTVTPAEIAKVLAHRNGQYKNVNCTFSVILNKSDSTERFRAAREAAAAFPGTALITAMQRDPSVYEIWRNGTCLW